jgi:hypothetical protein
MENNQLEARIRELEAKIAKLERLLVVTPTITTIKGNIRVEGTVHGDRLYRRGNTGNYSEVTT